MRSAVSDIGPKLDTHAQIGANKSAKVGFDVDASTKNEHSPSFKPSFTRADTKGVNKQILSGDAGGVFDRFARDGKMDKSTFEAEIGGAVVRESTRQGVNVAKEKKKKKYAMLGGAVLFALVASILVNFVIVFVVVDAQIPTKLSDSPGSNVLASKFSEHAVEVAQSLERAPLSSFLDDEAFGQLRYLTATSRSGAKVRAAVSSFLRIPARQCLPPIVKLITDIGTVHIEGTDLEFSEAVTPVFLEAGFLNDELAAANGLLLTEPLARRRLSLSALEGWYNTLNMIKLEANETRGCLPDLPSLPATMIAFSRTHALCGYAHEDTPTVILCAPSCLLFSQRPHGSSPDEESADCEDKHGFPSVEDLVGAWTVDTHAHAYAHAHPIPARLPTSYTHALPRPSLPLALPHATPFPRPSAPMSCQVGGQLVGGRWFKWYDEHLRRHTTAAGVVRRQTITRFPRFPELVKVRVHNGTHGMSWTEFNGLKFRCETGVGFDDSDPADWDDARPPVQTTTPTDEQAANFRKAMTPDIRYEGYTWYSSHRHAEAPAFHYKMTMAGATAVNVTQIAPAVQHYYGSVADINKPLGVATYTYNEHTTTFELNTRSDYSQVRSGGEVSADDVDDSHFALPEPWECVRNRDHRVLPPIILGNTMGVGTIRSSDDQDVWGEPLPYSPHAQGCSVNVSANESGRCNLTRPDPSSYASAIANETGSVGRRLSAHEERPDPDRRSLTHGTSTAAKREHRIESARKIADFVTSSCPMGPVMLGKLNFAGSACPPDGPAFSVTAEGSVSIISLEGCARLCPYHG